MITIYKYVIDVGSNTKDVNLGAEVLSIQIQHDRFSVWARVDDAQPKRPRGFYIAMTGQNLDLCEAAGWDYKGTVQHGTFVFHLFVEPS